MAYSDKFENINIISFHVTPTVTGSFTIHGLGSDGIVYTWDAARTMWYRYVQGD